MKSSSFHLEIESCMCSCEHTLHWVNILCGWSGHVRKCQMPRLEFTQNIGLHRLPLLLLCLVFLLSCRHARKIRYAAFDYDHLFLVTGFFDKLCSWLQRTCHSIGGTDLSRSEGNSHRYRFPSFAFDWFVGVVTNTTTFSKLNHRSGNLRIHIAFVVEGVPCVRTILFPSCFEFERSKPRN